MHPYYLKHKKRYAKEIEKLLSFGKTEVEELFEEDFPVIVKQVRILLKARYYRRYLMLEEVKT